MAHLKALLHDELASPPPSPSPTPSLVLLLQHLPIEILSYILTFLPLDSLIIASQLSSLFYQISSSSLLSPWSNPVDLALRPPPFSPYPRSLERLGCYSYIPRTAFYDILVKARPDFVGSIMELPVGLREADWEEVMRRRFLPSWHGDAWKREGMSWRTLFMRAIHRVAHRSTSTCTTEESYTRWVTLDRRGSATLNRVRAAAFDPLVVFQEIKLQNNLHHHPTTVRHVLSLTDVHVLAVGVLYSPTSLFVSSNAHAFLHPSLCYPAEPPRDSRPWNSNNSTGDPKMKGRERSMSEGGVEPTENASPTVVEPTTPLAKVASSGGRFGGEGKRKKIGLPLSRTISGSSSGRRGGGGEGSTSSGGNTLASIASFLKPKPHPNSSAFSIGTHHARSRDLISSSSTLGHHSSASSTPPSGGASQQGPPSSSTLTFLSPPPPSLRRSSTSSSPARPRRQQTVVETDRGRLPYRVMEHPRPTEGFRLYPNWTPGGEDTRRRPDGERVGWWERGGDEDDGVDDQEEEEEEWPEVAGTKKWVGPMMIIAALRTPGDRPFSPSSSTSPPPDLVKDENGHYLLPRPGSYASFEWEDLWAVAPWLKEQERVGTRTGGGIGFLRERI